MMLGGRGTSPPQRSGGTAAGARLKPRVVVTTDPELDDMNSLVRYLLYSTDFRTEALIHASSGFHWKGDGKGTKWFVAGREYTRFGLHLCPCTSWRWPAHDRHIEDVVDAYAKVYPDLKVHDPDYPSPAELRSKIYWGNVEFDGDISQDTPGSNRIKELLLDDEPGPIFLLAWGGGSTIARALKSIHDRYEGTREWPAIYQKVSRKAILSMSGDQDDTYAKYIGPNWPDIRFLSSGAGGVPLGYGAGSAASKQDAVYYGAGWTRQNVSSRGPLGALYRVWGDGKQMVKGDIFDYFGLTGYTASQLKKMGYIVWTPPQPKGTFLGEGDTFTFLNLIDNGLLAYQNGTPGGWGGHTPQGTAFVSSQDWLDGMRRAFTRRATSEPDFTPAAQNAFAARMKWSVTPAYAGGNHEPDVTIRGGSRISARPGETVRLQGVTSDPDGNTVTVKWWQWKDVGTYPGRVTLSHPTSLTTTMRVPADAKAGETIQLVLQATDDGMPALTRYQRIVVSITS